MTHKSLVLALIGLFSTSLMASAQDKLYKMSGEVIEVKVKEINAREIVFKKVENADGPTYTLPKREVERIEYQNGTEDVFNRAPMHRYTKAGKVEKVKYGKNIFAVAPLQITDAFGVGLSYERVLDKKGIISFYLPLAMSFNNDGYNNGPFNSSSPYYGSGSYYGGEYNSYYIMPGLKIYPTGSKGKVRYSVGPSIAAVFTKDYTNTILGYDYNGNPVWGPYGLQDRFVLGVMVNNTLNIQPTPHLYMGVELGLGISYMNQVNNRNMGETTLGQFAFKMGYRF
jgi:hypothetical protein